MISTPPTNVITETIRKNITGMLRENHAHIRFEDAVSGVPPLMRSTNPENLPYSIWQLVEHIRITQRDILEFCRSAAHKSPEWPQGYWTENKDYVNDETWESSLKQIHKDTEDFIALFNDPDVDIYIPFEYGRGQTYIRQALFIAGHTAYHTGQIVVVRRILNVWNN